MRAPENTKQISIASGSWLGKCILSNQTSNDDPDEELLLRFARVTKVESNNLLRNMERIEIGLV